MHAESSDPSAAPVARRCVEPDQADLGRGLGGPAPRWVLGGVAAAVAALGPLSLPCVRGGGCSACGGCLPLVPLVATAWLFGWAARSR